MIIEKVEKEFGGKIRFCTPGHKGKRLPFGQVSDTLAPFSGQEYTALAPFLNIDVTEADTHFPANSIKKAQQKTARHLKADTVRYLTNGSSIGIKAALMGTGDILTLDNAHQAIQEAADLGSAKVFFIKSKTKNGLVLPVSAAQIRDGLKRFPSVKTVVLTSPDYYGFNTAAEIADIVLGEGKRLYVDAAHGAHYLFRPDLFDCGLFKKAFAFNLSAHKTLPSFTQTAYLCINEKSEADRIDKNLKLLGTTSPSYPFFCSLECASDFTHSFKGLYCRLKAAVESFKQKVPCVTSDDFSRLVVDAKALNLSGKQLYQGLFKSGIVAEKFDKRYVVFITTLADADQDLARLASKILELKPD